LYCLPELNARGGWGKKLLKCRGEQALRNGGGHRVKKAARKIMIGEDSGGSQVS